MNAQEQKWCLDKLIELLEDMIGIGDESGIETDELEEDLDRASLYLERLKKKNTANQFSRWWTLYPIKKGKAAALKIWKKKKLDEQIDNLLFVLQNQINYDSKWKAGYIPHPTTYLNQERWEDDIETSRPVRETSATQFANSLFGEATGTDHMGMGYVCGNVWEPLDVSVGGSPPIEAGANQMVTRINQDRGGIRAPSSESMERTQSPNLTRSPDSHHQPPLPQKDLFST